MAMGLIAAHYSKNLTEWAGLDEISCRNFNGPAIAGLSVNALVPGAFIVSVSG